MQQIKQNPPMLLSPPPLNFGFLETVTFAACRVLLRLAGVFWANCFRALKRKLFSLILPVIATLALAGCGALFDSPDGGGGVADPGGNPSTVVMGCTDSAALNFNPLANAGGVPCEFMQPACGDNCPPSVVQTDLAVAVTVVRVLNQAADAYTFAKTGGVSFSSESFATAPVRTFSPGNNIQYSYDDIDALSNDYLIFGEWDSISAPLEKGAFVIGAPLPNDYSLPTSGTATYAGIGISNFNNANGNMGSVSFDAVFRQNETTMSGQWTYNPPGAQRQFLFGEATFDDGRFSGAVTCGNNCAGTLTDNTWQGAFFGTADSAKGNAPTKFGGTFTIKGVTFNSGTARVYGGFGASLDTYTP